MRAVYTANEVAQYTVGRPTKKLTVGSGKEMRVLRVFNAQWSPNHTTVEEAELESGALIIAPNWSH